MVYIFVREMRNRSRNLWSVFQLVDWQVLEILSVMVLDLREGRMECCLLGCILFFASRASDYCTGSQLIVDGGVSSDNFARTS